MHRTTTVRLLAAIGLSLVPASLNAVAFNDANWNSMGRIAGVGGTVSAAAVDSAGNIYIGGSFIAAGDIIANYIAKWNGSSWSALGSGMNGWGFSSVVAGSDGFV